MPNKDSPRQRGRQKSATNEKTSLPEAFSASSPEPKRPTARTPLRAVDSIIEDEEDPVAPNPPPPSRPRQLSAATAAGYRASSFIRTRSASTSDPSAAESTTPRQPTRSDSDSFSNPQNATSESTQKRRSPPTELDMGAIKTSSRLHRVSLDVDNVLGDSDDEILGNVGRKPSRVSNKHKGLSPSTRELIDFLSEGPPEPTMLSPNDSSLSLTPRKSGRLQKMISRITLAGSNESTKASRRMTGSHELSTSRNPSATNLSPLANRPVPPRYPTPGPLSATSSDRSSADQDVASARLRSQSAPRILAPQENGMASIKEKDLVPPIPTIISESDFCSSPGTLSKKLSDSALNKQVEPSAKSIRVESPSTHSRHVEKPPPASPDVTSVVPSPTPPAEPSPPPVESTPVPARVSSKGVSARPPSSESPSPPPAVPASVAEHVRDMRRVLAHATSAQECRLLVDIFLTRSKLIPDAAELHALAASPSDSATQEMNAAVENAVVGLFLGDSTDTNVKQPDAVTTTVTLLVNGHAESDDS